MKALIMAAGRGTRISRYLDGQPKCTVSVGGEALIHRTVRKLKEYGVTDIALVIGYQGQVIREVLADQDVTFVENPFFDVTNSIASAWFARDFIQDDDMLVMNGDVFMEDSLLRQIISTTYSAPLMYADESRKEEADYKFYYEDGKLILYGKELTGDQITGEYVGIACINCGFLPTFRQQLDHMIQTQQHGVWWENVLYSLCDHIDIHVQDVAGKFWAEVDYIEDYERIMAFVKQG